MLVVGYLRHGDATERVPDHHRRTADPFERRGRVGCVVLQEVRAGCSIRVAVAPEVHRPAVEAVTEAVSGLEPAVTAAGDAVQEQHRGAALGARTGARQLDRTVLDADIAHRPDATRALVQQDLDRVEPSNRSTPPGSSESTLTIQRLRTGTPLGITTEWPRPTDRVRSPSGSARIRTHQGETTIHSPSIEGDRSSTQWRSPISSRSEPERPWRRSPPGGGAPTTDGFWRRRPVRPREPTRVFLARRTRVRRLRVRASPARSS